MKKIIGLSFFLFLVFIPVHAQILVKGTVVNSKKVPIEGASVYLNNSTIGTATDKDGKFELFISEGKFELIVSFIGYKTIIHNIDTSTHEKPLFFKLLRATNFLDEAVVRKIKYDNQWKRNLSQFKLAFLGRTKLASQCKILNPKVLSFEFDNNTGILSAFAKEPLQIENQGLGYLIKYDLVHFSLEQQKVTYLGLTKYENITGKKAKLERWAKKRQKAYHGSLMHFIRSLRTKSLKIEGFKVHQFKRTPNPKRPPEEEISRARAYLKLNSSKTKRIDFINKMDAPKTPLDSAIWIVQKARLPKYQDNIYKRSIPYEDMISFDRQVVSLSFENYLSIIYTKESEEINYTVHESVRKNQTSAIRMINKTALLDPSGMIIDPLDVYAEGYWSYEQFADLLPLDYQPTKN